MKNNPILTIIAGVLVSAILIGSGYLVGNTNGQRKVNLEWSLAKESYNQELLRLADFIGRLESDHRQETSDKQRELNNAQKKYESTITDLRSKYVDSLRDSESRGQAYVDWLENRSTDTGTLASHAARLDRSLTEGRSLVQELRGIIEFRESQLRSLGSQIMIDRDLIKKFSEQK